ncbi:unnamed protein product [Rotaria magnacalcarata]|uniref:Kinesin light chain n=1 Tax=Rotaria magnacalcarata TaxID=392030 RepID=A0A8S2JI96_9BILA|nr:unnamed protein product [Rotaria magnacalcarata]
MAYQLPDRKPSFIINADENKESTTLICFDPNIEQLENSEKSKEQLRIINNYVIFSFDIEQCIRQIESINEEKIFLITSGLKASQILPRISSFQQIDSIFIFSQDNQQYDHLLSEYPKLLGSYIDFDDLSKSIKQQIDRVNNEIESFCFFDQYQILTKALSPESAKFLWAQLFHYLIAQLPQNQQAKRKSIQLYRAWIEFNIGRVLALNKESNEARIYYNHAYERMMNYKPARVLESAHVLNNIGCLLANQEKYDEAIDYHQRALEIREKFYPPGHIDIAQSLYNIGLILDNQGKYEDSLEYYQTALKIQEKCYPSVHPHIYRSLNSIGIILYRQGKYEQALDYYKHALKIEESLYPSGHDDLTYTLNNIGIILRNKGMHDEALQYCRRALDIEEKLYPSGHSNIAKSLGNIGNILSDQGKSNEALDYHQRALAIQEKAYPSGHVDIGHSLNNIGICYENLNKEKLALHYYQHALTIYEKFLPRDHPRRQRTEHNIHRLTQDD